jgi:hypothetical protein
MKLRIEMKFAALRLLNPYPGLLAIALACLTAGVSAHAQEAPTINVDRMAYGAFLSDACSFSSDIYANLKQIAELADPKNEHKYLDSFRRYKSAYANDSGTLSVFMWCYIQTGKYKSLVADIDTEVAEQLKFFQQRAERRQREARERAEREAAAVAMPKLCMTLLDKGLGQRILDRAWPLVSGELRYQSARIMNSSQGGGKGNSKMEFSIKYRNLLGLSQTIDVYFEISENSSKDDLFSDFNITDYSDFIPPKRVNTREINGFIRSLVN